MNPRPFVEELVAPLPPGRALELACGTGRNTVWLRRLGWDVTAVDRVPVAGVTTKVVDLTDNFSIEEANWDLIVMTYYLQVDLFPKILRGLRPGGIAVIMVHLFEPGHEASRFSLRSGELPGFFPQECVRAYREGKPEGGRLVGQLALVK